MLFLQKCLDLYFFRKYDSQKSLQRQKRPIFLLQRRKWKRQTRLEIGKSCLEASKSVAMLSKNVLRETRQLRQEISYCPQLESNNTFYSCISNKELLLLKYCTRQMFVLSLWCLLYTRAFLLFTIYMHIFKARQNIFL